MNLGHEAFDQVVACRGGARPCERRGGRTAKGPVRILGQGRDERGLGIAPSALRERRCRRHAIDRERRVGELLAPHRLGLVDIASGEHDVPRIEDRLARFACELGQKGLLGLADLDRYVDVGTVDPEPDLGRDPEQRRLGIDVLVLLDRHASDLGRGIPADRDVELGVSGEIDHPLAEEPIDDLAGRILDSAREVARFDEPVAMLREVVRERAVERGIAEQVAQHVKDATTLVVEVGIEDVDRLVVELRRDRPAIAAGVLAQVGITPLLELEIRGIATFVVLAPEVLRVGGEAFVEPAFAPVATGHEVAKPLMGELVGHQRIDVVVERRALVDEHAIGQRGRAGVLHAAEDEIGDEDLRVARIRIGDSELGREQLEHLGRARERAFALRFLAALAVVDHRHVAPPGLELGEIADRERDEIAAVRHVEPPVHGALRAGGRIGDERTVRQREHRSGHGRDDLARRFLVWRIEAREPVARVLVLALGPGLGRFRRVAVVGGGEVQAAPRRSAIGNIEYELVADRERGRLDAQLATIMAVGRLLAVRVHALDLELDRIELDRRGRRQRGRTQGRGAGDRACARIDLDLEQDVKDVDDAVRSELRLRAGKSKLASHAPRA